MGLLRGRYDCSGLKTPQTAMRQPFIVEAVSRHFASAVVLMLARFTTRKTYRLCREQSLLWIQVCQAACAELCCMMKLLVLSQRSRALSSAILSGLMKEYQ